MTTAPEPEAHPADELALLGGHLALDFANTVDWHASDEPRERLTDYDQLLRWCVHAGALDASEADVLRGEAAAHARRAEQVRRRAVRLREALYRVITLSASGEGAPLGDLDRINSERAAALASAELRQTSEGFAELWPIAPAESALCAPLWRIAHAIGELLTSDEMGRVRQCGDDRCGWLFVDRSRNRSRRWCSSADCGNRERVRRFLERRRGTAGERP